MLPHAVLTSMGIAICMGKHSNAVEIKTKMKINVLVRVCNRHSSSKDNCFWV